MAPTASIRASTRASSTRDQRSFPLQETGDRQSHSPVGRRTRSTRSQSRDLGGSDIEIPASTGGRRSRHQDSVESEGSVGHGLSDYSEPKTRRGRKNRAPEPSPDLSIVNEGPESEPDNEGVEEESDDDEDDGVDIELENQLLRSPSSVSQASQISRTTAITSASFGTTHSAEVIVNLDPMLVEFLPSLLTSARRILDLLAPPNASIEVIECIVRELKMLTSRRARWLKHNEEKFKTDREHFGEDHYINCGFIKKALLGTQDLDDNFRPDPIFHVANLASLVKELFVTSKEHHGINFILERINTNFPAAFLRNFDAIALSGNSCLRRETFELSLEIRTQIAIAQLFAIRQDIKDWDPEKILLSPFIEAPHTRQISPQLSYFDDVIENGDVLKLMKYGADNSDHEIDIIKSRVKEIHEVFQQNDDGDSIDFERLDEMFPWIGFLTQLARWCRLRLNEIITVLDGEKGTAYIVESLVKVINDNNSQAQLYFEPPGTIVTPQQTPSRTVIPSFAGQDLYNPRMVLELEKLKQTMSLIDNPPSRSAQLSSTENLPSSSAYRPGPFMTGALEPSEPSEVINNQRVYDYQPIMDNDDIVVPHSDPGMAMVWQRNTRNKNKENQPFPDQLQASTGKRSKPGHQKDAHYDLDHTSMSSSHKRHRPEDSDGSQDEDFQEDSRIPKPDRRMAVPRPLHHNPVRMSQSPPQMIRREPSNGRAARTRRQSGRQFEADQVVGADEGDEYVLDEDEAEGDKSEESDIPPPSHKEISRYAIYATARSSQSTYQTQRRIPWSEADTNHLIKRIGEHGPKWSRLEKLDGFEVTRNQGALKDKARNIKASFLKAGIPLPLNFEHVALARNQIEAVRRAIPNWEE